MEPQERANQLEIQSHHRSQTWCMLSNVNTVLYIEETGRTLKTRTQEHVNHIKKGHTDTVLRAHFAAHGVHNFKYIDLEHKIQKSKGEI